DLVGEPHDAGHGRIAIEEIGSFARDGGDDGGDELGIGGQGDIFLGPGADGVDGGGGVGLGAAGDDRNGDALVVERADEAGDIDHDVDQKQVGALAGAERGEGDLDGGGVGDLGPALHGELGGLAQLAVQGSDDQEAHIVSL